MAFHILSNNSTFKKIMSMTVPEIGRFLINMVVQMVYLKGKGTWEKSDTFNLHVTMWVSILHESEFRKVFIFNIQSETAFTFCILTESEILGESGKHI